MIELQQKLLADTVRNQAFYEALKKHVKKGTTTVTDIGSGTGFLSFLASQLGAKTCYGYEYSELATLSKKIAGENNIRTCTFYHAYSQEIKNPVRTDMVISETLGNFALEEHIIEIMNDAHRFLKPGGAIIPRALEQWVSPVTSPRIMKEIDIWGDIGFNINFARAREAALNNMYVYRIEPDELLENASQAHRWDEINFMNKNKSIRKGEAQWKITKNQTIWGFALWWTSTLTPGVELSTSPFSPRTHWEQIFLPLSQKIQLTKGDTLSLSLNADSRYEVGLRMTWRTRVTNSRKSIMHTSTMDTGLGL